MTDPTHPSHPDYPPFVHRVVGGCPSALVKDDYQYACILQEGHDPLQHEWDSHPLQCTGDYCTLHLGHEGEHSGPMRPVHVKAPCVYREGDRIRHTNGTGYADVVTDQEIIDHYVHHLNSMALTEEGVAQAKREAAFCRAVLALRRVERAQADLDAALGWLES